MKPYSIVFILFVLFASCGGNSKEFNQQTYEQHKESLAEKEKNNPLKFLLIQGDNKKNIIGQTVIRGKVSNIATVSSYKDVRVKLLCYKNNQMVEEHEDVINDVIKPGSTKDFKTKYRLPKGTDSVALSVMSATHVDAETK